MKQFKKTALSAICILEVLFVMGGAAACAGKENSTAPQPENAVTNETRQETAQSGETPQAAAQSGEMAQTVVPEITPQPTTEQQDMTQSTTVQQDMTQPATEQPDMAQSTTVQQGGAQATNAQVNTAQPVTVQPDTSRQGTNQPVPNGNEQISLEDAKNVALIDAGLSASDVIYTKEKLDYEDGIAVYEIEFYTGTAEYEYEINASTGAVYSKSVEMHHNQTGHGNAGTSQNDIGANGAKSIALNHAGFAEAEVSRLKTEYDIDDGLAVYEIEFDKDGREYEYKINAADGSIIEFDID